MSILAYDLGASSGRAIVGRLTDATMEYRGLHRFPNDPVQVGKRWHWDILRLFHELKQGLLKAKQQGIAVESLGIDSWAVDFGLLDCKGELLANPYHYRDSHTDGMMEKLFEQIPQREVFARTGIQFLPFNTIYQLFAMKQADSPLLREARHLLMIPDLLRYFLTGERAHEFSNATTTQLYNPVQGDWDSVLLEAIGVPGSWFGKVLQPGSPAGTLRASLQSELGIGSIPVNAVAEHDTGSAVAAIPAAESNFAYLSCGTWSLMGTEVRQPVMNEQARKLNFTNEGGVGGTYRLLKNIMGLWLLQECKREWDRTGSPRSFPELVELARQAPAHQAYLDPDDPLFMPPGDMPARVQQYCRQTGQSIPHNIGEIVRCVLESLALKYRYVFDLTEQLSDQAFQGLYMVGGGIHNTLLCEWTAAAIGKSVWAGPAEASAIGNLAVQWIARGDFSSIGEARQTIRQSVKVTEYEPASTASWEEAYGRFRQITGLS